VNLLDRRVLPLVDARRLVDRHRQVSDITEHDRLVAQHVSLVAIKGHLGCHHWLLSVGVAARSGCSGEEGGTLNG
jgi:hypothetical protein